MLTGSFEETVELGRVIGERLDSRAVLLLKGELGAGKTALAKGVAAGLGIDPSEVTSPSFTLINEHQGRLKMFHIDLYRLDAAEAEQLGLEEIFDQEAIILIEWGERLAQPPARARLIELDYVSDTDRRICVAE